MEEYPSSASFGDESTPTNYGDTNPTMPVSGSMVPDAAPYIPPPAATPPATSRNWVQRNLLLAIVTAVAVLGLLISTVAFAASHGGKTTPTSAADVIANANKAALNDATYKILDNTTINFSSSTAGSSPTTFNLTGTGKLTKSPARNDIAINFQLFGPQTTIEVLTDGTDGYVNLGALGGLFGSQLHMAATSGQWIKVPLGKQSPNLLDYSHLTNLKLIGAAQLNGKATWHIQGTLAADTAKTTPTPTPSGASATPVTEDLWFFQDTYFPAQFTVHLAVNLGDLKIPGLPGSSNTSGAATPSTVTTDATLQFTNWNSGITITPPPPSSVIGLPTGFPGQPSPTPAPGS